MGAGAGDMEDSSAHNGSSSLVPECFKSHKTFSRTRDCERTPQAKSLAIPSPSWHEGYLPKDENSKILTPLPQKHTVGPPALWVLCVVQTLLTVLNQHSQQNSSINDKKGTREFLIGAEEEVRSHDQALPLTRVQT